jgi:hypothetical protein
MASACSGVSSAEPLGDGDCASVEVVLVVLVADGDFLLVVFVVSGGAVTSCRTRAV